MGIDGVGFMLTQRPRRVNGIFSFSSSSALSKLLRKENPGGDQEAQSTRKAQVSNRRSMDELQGFRELPKSYSEFFCL